MGQSGDLTANPAEFRVHASAERLADLESRLRATNWPDDFANDDWRYGTNAAYLRELVEYWLDGYDWRAQEAAINAFDHYRVAVDGMPIHFLRVPGKGPNPLPLIASHGWPWTFWDYEQVIGPLTDPASHGGDAADDAQCGHGGPGGGRHGGRS